MFSVKIHTVVTCVPASCILLGRYQRFAARYRLRFKGRRMFVVTSQKHFITQARRPKFKFLPQWKSQNTLPMTHNARELSFWNSRAAKVKMYTAITEGDLYRPYTVYIYTRSFIMFSVITNIYNKKTKGPTLMELFTATGKLKKFFFFFLTTRDVRCVHHGWHGTHRYDIEVLATHTSTWVLPACTDTQFQ